MKLMIASDIHGSAYYCNKLIEAYENEKPDKLVLLGDILYHGPRNDLPREYSPKAVISSLNELKNNILCIRGNCDTEVDQMVLSFPVLADYGVLFVNGRNIYITHGHKYNEGNPLPMGKGDVMMNGHTHVPKFVEYETYTFINPGSVSIPKENSPHSYVIIEGEECVFKDVETLKEYDRHRL